ncbi:MAG TPA: hypothetical protein VMB70_11295 [Terriglobia bacterium]|nr:hypothetical protein [Terriglobia bacterium]
MASSSCATEDTRAPALYSITAGSANFWIALFALLVQLPGLPVPWRPPPEQGTRATLASEAISGPRSRFESVFRFHWVKNALAAVSLSFQALSYPISVVDAPLVLSPTARQKRGVAPLLNE